MIPDFETRLSAIDSFDGNLAFGAKVFHQETNRTGVGRPGEGGLVFEHSKIIQDTHNERYQPIGNSWEPVDCCPACNDNDQKPFLTRLGLTIQRCSNCGHRFQNPRITLERAIELYADDRTAAAIYSQPLQLEIDSRKYRYGLQLLEWAGYTEKDGLLDFGCGVGLFLREAHSSGWTRCIGIDANQNYQRSYQGSHEIEFINTNFESLDSETLGSNFSAIAMWNVLEHIYEPFEVLSKLRKLLSDTGLLLIMVPNVESLATRIIREKSATFNWKHISHFSARSLRTLLERSGFIEIHLETVISEIDNIKSYLSGEHPYHGHGDPENLFDFITPRYIHQNFLGSRLLGVFRRA